jgi:exopolysaccharide biosynthesis polyprenyl glycosylphosphotransferase
LASLAPLRPPEPPGEMLDARSGMHRPFVCRRGRLQLALESRTALVRAMLVSADVIALGVAFASTEVVFAWLTPGPIGREDPLAECLLFLLLLPTWPVIAAFFGLYRHDGQRTDHSTIDELGAVFQLLTVGTWLFVVAAYVTAVAQPSPPKLVFFWFLALVLLSLGRVTARAFCRRRLAFVQNTIIVGAGKVGQLLARKLLQHPEYGINVLGFVDADPLSWTGASGARLTHGHEYLLGDVDDLPAIVDELDVDRVVVAFSETNDELTLAAVRLLADVDVQIDVVPRLFELIGPNAVIHTAEGVPLIGVPPVRLSRLAGLTKRAIDLSASFVVLLVLFPVLAVVAVAIKLDSSGPVLFRQTRMGARNRPFTILKFRTMVVDADAHKLDVAPLSRHAGNGGDPRMFKVPDDPRVTRIGRLLRRYSIDELPQLVNVVLGDMSLVGPRPLILTEDSHVDGWARRRLDVKPGITGLWQVHGGSAIPFGEMVQLDYLYVRTWSLWNDVRLIFRTLPVVCRGTGC